MYQVVPRKRKLEWLVKCKGNNLFLRQWWHGVNGLVAVLISTVDLLSGFGQREMTLHNYQYMIMGVLYAYAHAMWLGNVFDETLKFHRQVEFMKEHGINV